MSELIALISDMHLAPESAGAERAQSDLDRPGRRSRRFLQALEEAKAAQPAAILFGGDNTNQPVDGEPYRLALMPHLAALSVPWFAIPGNHDVGSTVGWHHHDAARMARCCEIFRTHIGPDRWVCEAAGFRILGVNSQTFGADLAMAREQEAWLAEELARPTELLKTVFLHTPPYLETPEDDFANGSEQMCLMPEARQPLLEILEAAPPALVINGHCHRFWQRQEPRWDWLGLPATALGQDEMVAVPSQDLPAGDDRVGWVALRRDGDGWQAELKPVD